MAEEQGGKDFPVEGIIKTKGKSKSRQSATPPSKKRKKTDEVKKESLSPKDKSKTLTSSDKPPHITHNEEKSTDSNSKVGKVRKKHRRKKRMDLPENANTSERSNNNSHNTRNEHDVLENQTNTTKLQILDNAEINQLDNEITKKKEKQKLERDIENKKIRQTTNFSLSKSSGTDGSVKGEESVFSSDHPELNESEVSTGKVKKTKKHKDLKKKSRIEANDPQAMDEPEGITKKKKRENIRDSSTVSNGSENCDNELSQKRRRKESKCLQTMKSIEVENSTDSEENETEFHPTKRSKLPSSNISKLKKLFSQHDYELLGSQKRRSAKPRRKFAVALDPLEQVQDNERKLAPIEESPGRSFEEVLESVEERDVANRTGAKDLAKLNILVPWPVPPIHLIETRVAGRPSEKQKKELKSLDLPIKTGNFSQAEDEQVKKNWKYFCKMHGLPKDPAPFLNLLDVDKKPVMPTQERVNFVRFLAHGLENRLLCSVYRRFRRLHLNEEHNLGCYTSQEDKVIIDYIKKSSSTTPYADLAKLLKRSRLSIEKRCTKLADQMQNSSRIEWNKEFIENFMNHLVHITHVDDVSDLKERKITGEEWDTMSRKLGISKNKLQRGWNFTVFPKIFLEKTTRTKPLKIKLVQSLIERGEKDWRLVNWDEIAQSFGGFSPKNLNRIMKDTVAYHCPLEMQHDLGASLEYINTVVSKQEKTGLRNRSIRKIQIIDNRKETET